MAEDEFIEKAKEILENTPLEKRWCAPSEVIYGNLNIPSPLEFPKVQTKRGGIYFPRYRVETTVQPAKKRLLRRRMWQLHVRYWNPAAHESTYHVMVFASEQDANNAEQIIKFMIKNINNQVEAEKRAR